MPTIPRHERAVLTAWPPARVGRRAGTPGTGLNRHRGLALRREPCVGVTALVMLEGERPHPGLPHRYCRSCGLTTARPRSARGSERRSGPNESRACCKSVRRDSRPHLPCLCHATISASALLSFMLFHLGGVALLARIPDKSKFFQSLATLDRSRGF